MTKTISLIVPMHNEADVIDIFFTTLFATLKSSELRFEIVCINDGSCDNTLEKLRVWHSKNNNIVIVNLSRNFGKEAATSAGLAHCRGDAAIPIDADLQDPPEVILQLIAKWHEGYEHVIAIRKSRHEDSLLQRITAKLFYKIFNLVAENNIPANAGDFRLLDRKIINNLLQLKEKCRFMKGLFNWVGYKTATIYFERPARAAGRSSWRIIKLWDFALDGIFSFSSLPLRIWSYLGAALSSLSLLYMMYIIFKTLHDGTDVPGYASTMVVILFMGGIQLLSLGIIGEYIARIYTETKDRPLYVVESVRRHDTDA